MQQPVKKMDIHITLGEEDGLQFLADVTGTVTSNPTLIQNIINESQLKQNVGDDMILIFHYYIQQGKQKEAVAYFEEALDEKIGQDSRSPIQKHLRRPLSKGKVEVVETPGCIILKYRFFQGQLYTEDEANQFFNNFDKFQKATFNFSTSLKGYLKHNNNNRTNVKVDYVDTKLYSNEISPTDLNNLLDAFKVLESDKKLFQNIPLFKMLGNLRTAQFEIKLASFREIRSYYRKVSNIEQQKQDKPFPYVNRGIFRKQISVFGIFKNKIAVKFDGIYNGEDVLMRLVKVYQTFFAQALKL